MADYVAFLRAINLGKNRKFPMAELRACLEDAGFEEPETYIASGNVRIRSALRSAAKVADRLEEVFEADRGFAVPTVVVTAKELSAVYGDAMALEPPSKGHAEGLRRYVTLLKQAPTKAVAAEVEELSTDEEVAWVRGRAVHLWMQSGYQSARLNNARVEKLLGVATTRDLKVITTLAQRWGA